ncbi:methyltransferase family protein [Alteromonadaceae bacterium 2753L.S.0a.02]|nr:methyltransferase family protein [Alteromonadaceae bacterium 2753L.S.0a.02]
MWDARYSEIEYAYGKEPNEFLATQFPLLGRNAEVLCLADGEGRNGVYLAQQGYSVTSVDASAVGLQKAQQLANERAVSINCVHADLQNYDLGVNRWDAIVSIFCHLPSQLRCKLHQAVHIGLRHNGVFILEAYTPAQLHQGTGGPPVADLLMTAENLRHELTEMHFSHLEELNRDVVEGKYHTGRASVVQVIAHKSG